MNNSGLQQINAKLIKANADFHRVIDNINIAANTQAAGDITKLAQSKLEFKQTLADLLALSKGF